MRGDRKRGKDRESGRRDGKEDWGLGIYRVNKDSGAEGG